LTVTTVPGDPAVGESVIRELEGGAAYEYLMELDSDPTTALASSTTITKERTNFDLRKLFTMLLLT